MTVNNKKRLLTGIILISSGAIFLGESLGKYNFDFIWFIRNFWPLILIIIGLHMILINSKLWWIIPVLVILATIYLIYFLHQYNGNVFWPERIFRFYHFRFR